MKEIKEMFCIFVLNKKKLLFYKDIYYYGN